MNLQQIEDEARALPTQQLATLICHLIDQLPVPPVDVSDDEVLERDAELESGKAHAISHEEFIRGVNASRSR